MLTAGQRTCQDSRRKVLASGHRRLPAHRHRFAPASHVPSDYHSTAAEAEVRPAVALRPVGLRSCLRQRNNPMLKCSVRKRRRVG